MKLAFCWSHVRRGFTDLAAKGASPIAAEVLKRIAALYRIEGETAGLSAAARRQASGERSRPLLTALDLFLRDKLSLLSQKSTLAVAIRYATSRWAGLTLYADDGRVEMDSNTVERSIRPLSLTRKNALFAGSDRGGQTWAVIASLVEPCKLNGVDPQAYLGDVISRIVGGHPKSQLDELMPWAYPTIPGLEPPPEPSGAPTDHLDALPHKAPARNVGSAPRLRCSTSAWMRWTGGRRFRRPSKPSCPTRSAAAGCRAPSASRAISAAPLSWTRW